MKRRSISCLLLLLALCLLLSSCGGAYQPAVVSVVGSKFSSFWDKSSNLLKGNTPIFAEGVYRYVVESDGKCKNEIDALLSAVTEKTGADMRKYTDATAPKLRIGLNLKEGLSASDYYIGFQERDLVITAVDEWMLAEALRYTESVLLNGAAAVAGQGYWYLPKSLSYKGGTVNLFDNEGVALYEIIVPESGNVSEAVTALSQAIKEKTGGTVPVKSDFFKPDDENEAREILLGLTNRQTSVEINETLTVSDYYIGIKGNQIIITAHNSYMLLQAVNTFAAKFIWSEQTAAYHEPPSLPLPETLSQLHQGDMLLLSQNGGTEYKLIYPAGLDEESLNSINFFIGRLAWSTGTSLVAYSDADIPAPAEGAKEILIGATNRPASIAARGNLEGDDWNAFFTEESLVVALSDISQLSEALNELLNALRREFWKQNTYDENLGYYPNPILLVPRGFYVSKPRPADPEP